MVNCLSLYDSRFRSSGKREIGGPKERKWKRGEGGEQREILRACSFRLFIFIFIFIYKHLFLTLHASQHTRTRDRKNFIKSVNEFSFHFPFNFPSIFFFFSLIILTFYYYYYYYLLASLSCVCVVCLQTRVCNLLVLHARTHSLTHTHKRRMCTHVQNANKFISFSHVCIRFFFYFLSHSLYLSHSLTRLLF